MKPADPESDAHAHLLGALQVDCEGDEHAVALQVGNAALESGIPHIDFGPAAQQPLPSSSAESDGEVEKQWCHQVLTDRHLNRPRPVNGVACWLHLS